MTFEAWWLLAIPLFFGLGWVAARVDIRQLLSESRSLPKAYFKALHCLLNDQPDQAIDAFIDIVKLDPEAAELHFALGHLFRRRGEIERAVRIHQNLLARPDLPLENQHQAQYELGQDYLKAGLLGHAEEAFHALIGTPLDAYAGRALLEIYQREKEWQRAITAAIALQTAGAQSPKRHKEIAQFHCELAQDALVDGHLDTAMYHLHQAQKQNRHNVRSTVLMGDVYLRQGNIEAALQTWRRVEQQSSQHVVLVAQRLMDGHAAVGRPQEGIDLLRTYLEEGASVELLQSILKTILVHEGPAVVHQLAHQMLHRTPTLLGLDIWLQTRAMLLSEQPESRPLREELSDVKNLVHSYTQRFTRYQCRSCGFRARQFYWQCPACSRWETMPPCRVEEFKTS